MGIRAYMPLAAGLLGTAILTAAEIKNSDCLECHSDKTLTTTNAAGVVHSFYMDAAVLADSVHRKISCGGCHDDLTAKHPDDNVAAQPVNCSRCHETQSLSYGTSVHGTARIQHLRSGKHDAPQCVDCHGTHGIVAVTLPASPLYFTRLARTCGQCHEQEAADVMESVHGKALAAGRRDAPTCTDCHAEHKIQELKDSSSLVISENICGKCHASERLNTEYNLPPDRVKTFFASYHGLAAQYGSARAANCGSCHGFHKILPSTDPRSSIYSTNLVATCGQCHPGASANFARGKIHLDVEAAGGGGSLGERINWWVRKIYLVMIFAVIGLMAAHNGLVFGRKAAARARRAGRTIVRMDFSQRAQHFVLAFSFIVLALTGFALKFPDSWVARLLGSDEAFRRWAHRIAGVALLLAGAYHAGYALAAREGRQFARDIVPRLKDLRDLACNALYLTGFRKTGPKFGRFGYAEKMEYWAVVWGTIIMGATGLMIWFKINVTRLLPRWAVDVATTVHYYEAILACLAILVWHFYHVIFDPDVYPLNRAALDGRVSEEWYAREHPLDARPVNKFPAQAATTTENLNGCNGRAVWLEGGAGGCNALAPVRKEALRLVLLGPPGVGKGTQAELLHQWSGACHLSTGDVFRAAKSLPPEKQTPAIREALDFMARGQLVPDETVLALIRERMRCLRCYGGFLLDGFPRTVAQALALEKLLDAEGLPLTAVINYNLPIEQIVQRLAGRRVCVGCRAVTQVSGQTPQQEICPHCGGRLYQREDDRPETIRIRMEAYRRSTEPLIEFYRHRGLLETVVADGIAEEVLRRSVMVLEPRLHPTLGSQSGRS